METAAEDKIIPLCDYKECALEVAKKVQALAQPIPLAPLNPVIRRLTDYEVFVVTADGNRPSMQNIGEGVFISFVKLENMQARAAGQQLNVEQNSRIITNDQRGISVFILDPNGVNGISRTTATNVDVQVTVALIFPAQAEQRRFTIKLMHANPSLSIGSDKILLTTYFNKEFTTDQQTVSLDTTIRSLADLTVQVQFLTGIPEFLDYALGIKYQL